MRPEEYTRRQKQRPCQIKNKSRYVMGRLHSHRRPVQVPLDMEPEDNPRTRGLTRDDETQD
jgi:hypothetical protein